MNVLIIDNKPEDINLLIDFCKRSHYDFTTIMPADIHKGIENGYDLIILTGGLWYKDPTQQQSHYGNEMELISTNNNVPVLGICLGMQLTAATFGGRLMELKRESHGQKKVQLTNAGKESLPWSDDFCVYENHSVGVVECPESFEALATSEECIEIIKHKSRPIVGVQFHPEKLHKKDHAEEVWSALLKLVEK